MAKRKKVGLALGGGAARGLAHIGVLQVLEREGIPVDMIAGTSIGALVGAFYSYFLEVERIEQIAREVGVHRLRLFSDFGIPRTGLIRWTRLENRLKKVLGGVEFKDLRIPFACVASNIDTGREIIFNSGPVWEAVRASATIPGVLALNESFSEHYVDGGVLNPVPVSTVREMGADFIIAVNVLDPGKIMGRHDHNFFSIIMKSMYLMSNRVTEEALKQADVVVVPDTNHIGFMDFQKVD
ncbi:MAG TPA: patatin-like phospholipase family protein, partial [Dehalococcoidales bacterium]|nr:patatin-like phospholipase family protein [Dehalococcoidales bacterium]